MKTQVILLVLLIVLAVGLAVYQNLPKEINAQPINETIRLYQGPVPEGFDLEHFRQTGETIK